MTGWHDTQKTVAVALDLNVTAFFIWPLFKVSFLLRPSSLFETWWRASFWEGAKGRRREKMRSRFTGLFPRVKGTESVWTADFGQRDRYLRTEELFLPSTSKASIPLAASLWPILHFQGWVEKRTFVYTRTRVLASCALGRADGSVWFMATDSRQLQLRLRLRINLLHFGRGYWAIRLCLSPPHHARQVGRLLFHHRPRSLLGGLQRVQISRVWNDLRVQGEKRVLQSLPYTKLWPLANQDKVIQVHRGWEW